MTLNIPTIQQKILLFLASSLSFFFFLSFILCCYYLCRYTVFIVFVVIDFVVILFIMIVFIVIVFVIIFKRSSLSLPLPTHITVPNQGPVPLLPLLTCITAPAHLHYCSSLWMSGYPILSFRRLVNSYYPGYRLLLIDAVTIDFGYCPFSSSSSSYSSSSSKQKIASKHRF